MAEEGCTELYLEVGNPPYSRSRRADKLDKLNQYETIRREISQRLLYDILSDEQIIELEEKGVLMLFYSAQHIAKFNVYVIHHQGNVEATFHLVPNRG